MIKIIWIFLIINKTLNLKLQVKLHNNHNKINLINGIITSLKIINVVVK
jgi:hypothetical protein